MQNIKLTSATRECNNPNVFLGYEGENNANKLVFEFTDGFVDGLGVLYVKRGEEPAGTVELDKVGETYEFPVKSSILSKVGEIIFQVSITTSEGKVIKYDKFTMVVKDALDSDIPMPEEYPSWIEMANEKLAEIDGAITETKTATAHAEEVANNILTAKVNGEFNGKDGEDGISPTAKVAQTAEGAEVTVTDATGTTTATIKHGKDGTDGADGISSEISVKTSTETEYVLTIKDKNGSFDTPNLKGKDSEGGIVNETDPVYLADKPNLALKKEIPTKVSELTNDIGYITDYTETDPTVPSHVKAITQANITNWNNKQDALTAGNNITIENGVISATGSGEGGLAELPIATTDTLGGIKVGEGLEITEDGILSALGGGSGAGFTKTKLLPEIFTTATSTTTLSDNIKNYDFVLVNTFVQGSTHRTYKKVVFIATDDIVGGNSDEFCVYAGSEATNTAYGYVVRFGFSEDGSSLMLGQVKKGSGFTSNTIGIENVYGIKLGGGSSYKEVDLISSPVEYNLGPNSTNINQDLVFNDSITNYDQIIFIVDVYHKTQAGYLNATNISMLVSGITYNNSDSAVFNGSAFYLSTIYGAGYNSTYKIGTLNAFSAGVHFKNETTLRIRTTVGTMTDYTKFRIKSVKGIKY